MARGLTVQQDFGVKSLFPRQLKSFYTAGLIEAEPCA
jgi:hypothetical protein